MARWRNTLFTEHAPESPNERWGAGSSAITRQFDLMDGSFQGRMQAAYDFLGYSSVVTNTNPTTKKDYPYYISRVTPMPYAALPSASFSSPDGSASAVPDVTERLYAIGVSKTEPLGRPEGVNLNATPSGGAAANYSCARQTVEFSTRPYQIKSDAAISNKLIADLPLEGNALQDLGWQNTALHRPSPRSFQSSYQNSVWRTVVGK